ncbi:MAG: hypothetical protein ACTS27_00145 [Phycisphaerales bacterium]
MGVSRESMSFAAPVIVAVVIASSSYLLSAVRFGDPLRQARQAADDAANLREGLPDAVERAVDRRLKDVERAESRIAAAERAAAQVGESATASIRALQSEIVALRESLARTEAMVLRAARSADEARLLAASGSGPTVIRSASPEVHASPVPEYAAPPAKPESAQVPAPELRAVRSVRDGPLRLDVLDQYVTSEGLVLECMLTKETPGEIRVEIRPPDRATRALTNLGQELTQGRIRLPNGRDERRTARLSITQNASLSLRFTFSGEFPDGVVARRIEIVGQREDGRQMTPMQFVIEDVVAPRR